MPDTITDDQRFRAEFLLKCAERGLSVSEAHDLVKEALHKLEESPTEKEAGIPEMVGSFAGNTLKTIGTGALLIPPIAATGAGWLLGRSSGGLSEADVKEEKDRELIQAYRDAAERAKRQSALAAKRRSERGKAVRSLL